MNIQYMIMIGLSREIFSRSLLRYSRAMADAKRQHSDNFTAEERIALIETMRNFISIIGDKRCDTKANQKKADAWKAITSEMSISFPDRKSRSAKDYKELWRRMKNKAKGLARDKKLDINQTDFQFVGLLLCN